jgi:hypothetical protein
MACEAKAMGENREFDDEALVSRLRELGLRFPGPTPSKSQKPSDLPARALLTRLILHSQPRMRLALILSSLCALCG